ncbi:response regulator transcription factor [Kallotenue papyrolyticum]|uniref:response regulator transcription factor n=1 Tax=Kallotenue papyrolyticum TaxID=1325125 RepID=UPI0004922E34|nr:response regulator [Kallotenue papyrolyticum]
MKTILVIEDESSIAHLLLALLEMEGYRVVTAQDGHAGLALLRTLRPDLVLCDLMMPHLDGRGVVQAMRADAEMRDIPVILMSAGVDRVDGLDGLITAFVRKPFEIAALLSLIRELVG